MLPFMTSIQVSLQHSLLFQDTPAVVKKFLANLESLPISYIIISSKGQSKVLLAFRIPWETTFCHSFLSVLRRRKNWIRFYSRRR